jgi:SAM-dependent methyltransferase
MKASHLHNPSESEGIGSSEYFSMYYGSREPCWYSFLLRDVIERGKPGTLLELGCGTGLFLELATRWGLQVAGVEGSAEAVALAKERFPKLNIIHHRLSNELPFLDKSCDNVLLNQVIEHLPPNILKNTLDESFRVLKPGGIIFIFSPGKANWREVQKDPTHCNPLYPSELRWQLRDSGFEMVFEPNSLRFLTRTPRVQKVVWKLTSRYFEDWLSATANAVAQRPKVAVGEGPLA